MIIIVIALVALLVFILSKVFRHPGISPLLSGALALLVLYWYLIPIVFAIFFAEALPYSRLVDDSIYWVQATIELLSLILALCFLLRKNPVFPRLVKLAGGHKQISYKTAVVAALIGVLLSWFGVLQISLGQSYLERNAFAVVNSESSEFATSGVANLVDAALLSFAYACLLTRWYRGGTRTLHVLAVLSISLANVLYLARGGRLAALVPLALVFLGSRTLGWSPRFKRIVMTSTLTATVVMGLFVTTIASYRTKADLTLEAVPELAFQAITNVSADPAVFGELLAEVVTKFDGISWGASLLEKMGPATAGWSPYEGVLTALIPRQLLQTKPVPGSFDGTYAGHPSRLAPILIGSQSPSYNVQVSPAAVTVWQFGYLGLIPMILLNVIQLYFINSLLLSNSLLPKAAALFLIGIPACFTLFSSPDVLLMNIQRVFAVYSGLYIANLIVHARLRDRHSTEILTAPRQDLVNRD